MKNGFIFTLAVLAGTFMLSGEEPATSMVHNGDMKAIEQDGITVRGWSYPKNSRIVNSGGKTGIEFNGSVSQWGLQIPEGKYKLCYFLKKDCENVLGIRLYCRDMQNNEVKNTDKLSYYVGQGKTFKEWTLQEFVFEVPQNKNCGLIFSSHGGIMAIGNVSLVKVGETPAPSSQK